jgi:RNA polymerase sigma-70 factor (ECF subfamily)
MIKSFVEKFNDIYKQYYGTIYKLVAYLIQSQQDVPDIVQNVFVKLYLQMQQGVVVEFPKTWLSKVAVNESHNFRTRKRIYYSLDTVWNAAGDEADQPENQLARAETRNRLLSALDRLNEKDKVLLTLYSESFSYKEISEIADIRFSSVGKSISRALEKLKNKLTK